MNKSFTEDGLQFAWDATSLKVAEECLYKYKLWMIEGWRAHRTSVHLTFGGWYASALERYHHLLAEGIPYEDAVIEIVHKALIDSWVYPPCPECNGGSPDCDACEGSGQANEGGEPWVSDHNAKTRENLIRTIVWYCAQFQDDSCETIILSNGKPAVEHSFQLPVDNDIILCGHLDRLVSYGDKPYIQDQKTTGTTITARYFDQWNLDTQMSLYTFAGSAIFNLPVKGVIIDAAQIAVGFSRFERGFTFRDSAQLQEWYDTTMYRIASVHRAARDNFYPMNTASCDRFGGCQFKHVCSKSPAVRRQFLLAEFNPGTVWSPIEPR